MLCIKPLRTFANYIIYYFSFTKQLQVSVLPRYSMRYSIANIDFKW